MIGIDIRTAKRGFFNAEKVRRKVEAAERRVLSRFGAFVRQTAIQDKLRKRADVSRPGRPPSVHTTPGLRLVLFAYDFHKGSVVIGPVKFHGRSDYGPTTIPELMEHGDTVRGRDKRMHRYEARPFMGPAYEENLPKLPAMWRDSVR
jgi:hypothetical protein